jgi:transcriptional regulator with XRE-family HTH domain
MRRAAHFCMPVINKELPCAYNHDVDFKLVREGLRRARALAPAERDGIRRVGMTLDEAAEKSGLNRATIHSIENTRREPKLRPEFETIERLARTYGLTLSAFFARIEGVPAPAPSLADEGLQPIVPIDQIAERVIQTLAELLARAGERADEEHHRQTSDPHPAASDGAPPRRVRTRGAPKRTKKPGRRRKG